MDGPNPCSTLDKILARNSECPLFGGFVGVVVEEGSQLPNSTELQFISAAMNAPLETGPSESRTVGSSGTYKQYTRVSGVGVSRHVTVLRVSRMTSCFHI